MNRIASLPRTGPVARLRLFQPRLAGMIAFTALALMSATAVQAGAITICTWTGGSATSALWSHSANWDNCGGAHALPADGDVVRFPAGAARPANQNDLVGLELHQLQFTGPNFNLTGEGIAFNGLIVSTADAVSSGDVGPIVGLPITLVGSTSVTTGGSLPLQLSAPLTLDASLVVQGTGETRLGALAGASVLIKQGTGTLVIGAAGSHAGPTQVQGGVLNLRADSGSPAFTVASGASLLLETADGSTLDAALQLAGTGAPGLDPLVAELGLITWTGPVALDGGVRIRAGGILDLTGVVSGSGGLTKTGTGTLTLSGANTYAGATQVDAGALRLQSSAALGSANGEANTVNEGATLEVEGGIAVASEQLTLNGTGMVGATLRSLGGDNTWTGSVDGITATVDVAAGTLTLGGGVASGGTRAKTGAGTLILSGSQTFEGAWSVYAGTLQLQSATAGHVITYADSILTGNGTIGFLTAQDGTIAPQGTLNASYLAWYPAAELAFRLGPTAAGSDRLNLFGSLWRSSDPGDLHIRFDDAPAGPPTPFELYTLVNFPSGPFFPLGGTNFTVDDLSHSYRGVPGNHGLNGMFELTSTQLQFVSISVSLFRDDFEGQP